ncbi:MAG: FAD-dependent oxidoreductase [Roseovarius sp.]
MFDFAIIGAGPAGMSAAISAQELGLKTVLLDDQPSPGGQIYRNVQDSSKDHILGKDYFAGRDLVQKFLTSGVDYRPNSRVWRVDQDGICLSNTDASQSLTATHVLMATGAMERPAPTLGWTLPGVMTAGSAQIMLKTSGLVASDAVFVGSGPLIYLIVAQYLRAGVRIKAVLDTTPKGSSIAALRHGGGIPRGMGYLVKGLGLLNEIRRAGIRNERITDYIFQGDSKLEAIEYHEKGSRKSITCETAFVHQGVIPAVNASMSTGCAHVWNEIQTAWQPKADGFGRTNIDWLRVAGDGAGIAGAKSAQLTGSLAAIAVASDQGRLKPAELQRSAADLQRLVRKDGAIRPFLDQLYRPADGILAPVDDAVTVCRCELVTRGQIKAAVSEGCPGPNQMKAFTRSGMGPCQGRMCGPVVTGIIADLTLKTPENVGHYRIRSPFRPITVSDLARLNT